jgi:hypothetical protein
MLLASDRRRMRLEELFNIYQLKLYRFSAGLLALAN